jgi:tight adherence protein B
MAFIAVVGTLLGAYSLIDDLWLRRRSRLCARLDDEFGQANDEQHQKSPLFRDLDHLRTEIAGARPSLRRRWVELLVQADLPLSVKQLCGGAAGLALLLGAGGGCLARSLFVGWAGLLIGVAGPFVFVYLRRDVRRNKLLVQMPEALDLMARTMRAGRTLTQAMQSVADEFKAPLGPEFAACGEQQNLGVSSEEALRGLSDRTGLLELKVLVVAILVHQQTGGNLAELLEKLAGVVRDRFRVRGRVQAMTAEGRLQAVVLLLLPPVLFGVMFILRRSYIEILFQYPYLLAGMVVSQLIGMLWIRKTVNFDQ